MSQHPRTHLRTTPSGSGTATPTSATHGSQTILQTNSTNSDDLLPSATLRLRADHNAQDRPSPRQQQQPAAEPSRRIRWSEDVIDNEGMGKKSSKVCCIYHAPREPGDSDSESDSSSDDDSGSDSEPDLSRAQPAGGRNGRRRGRHAHGGGGSGDKGKGKERPPSPNAYERQPKNGHKHKQAG